MEKSEFVLENNKYYKMSNFDLNDDYNIDFWNIDETIFELSYLTHDYFRYYGKFPSKVGKKIIEELLRLKAINIENDFLFDNYEGSGTSLVEAKIKGLCSIGIDINPFAVLSSRVKTYNLDIFILIYKWEVLKNKINNYINYFRNNNGESLDFQIEKTLIEKIIIIKKNVFTEFKDIKKWFDEDIITDLAVIKTLLLEMELDRYREFFVLAFFAIIRRVSFAYDGEVRPHVNKKKRKRDVLEVYLKKVNEMINKMREWNTTVNSKTYSNSYICSNINESEINEIVSNTKKILNKELGLVISHPPYLNCFDYIPIYKLKFQWAVGFEEIYGVLDYNQIKESEIKCFPINGDKTINEYFESNRKIYEIVYNNLKKNGYCCIVIGDCTVKQQLFSIHKGFIKMLEQIGFTVEKIVYRSTNYGLGKYAYNYRASYNEGNNSKKDAIIFFKK